MSAKHTPGPWAWVQAECGGWELRAPTGRVHSDGSACDEYGPDIDVHGPDGRLLAAAPDLLEAADFAMRHALLAAEPVSKGDPFMRIDAEMVYAALDKLRAAIAKTEVQP